MDFMTRYEAETPSDREEKNYIIAMIGTLPFAILLFSFLIVLCRRKIEDYYLRWSIITFIVAMALRVGMSFIVIAIYASDNDKDSESIVELKFSLFSFSLPYYSFLMVTVSLLFSALEFYHDVKNLIYPTLETRETCLTRVKASKWRFLATQTVIFLALFFQVLVVSFKSEMKNEDTLFGTIELTVLIVCEVILYTMQVIVLVLSYNVFFNLVKMNKAEPAIESSNDYGLLIRRSIKKRLPRIVCSFAVMLTIQTGFFILLTIEIFDDWMYIKKSAFESHPEYEIVQLCLEFFFCIFIFVAICCAQKKRRGAE